MKSVANSLSTSSLIAFFFSVEKALCFCLTGRIALSTFDDAPSRSGLFPYKYLLSHRCLIQSSTMESNDVIYFKSRTRVNSTYYMWSNIVEISYRIISTNQPLTGVRIQTQLTDNETKLINPLWRSYYNTHIGGLKPSNIWNLLRTNL